MEPGDSSVILASRSEIRLELLRRAGVPVGADPAAVDEAAVKARHRIAGPDGPALALALAEMKAKTVGDRHPGCLIIGADQLLIADNRGFDKPRDLGEARAQLHALRGRSHELVTAVVLVRDGAPVWRHLESARLTMRSFSEAFLEEYLAAVGPEILGSVGGYQLEGRGGQLFAAVEGDYFSILGLPLLPLLEALRAQGVLRT